MSSYPRSSRFVLTVTFILVGALARAESTPRSELLVQLCDGTGLSPRTRNLLAQEVRNLFNESGVDLICIERCGMEPLENDSSHVARVYILHEIPRPLLAKIQKDGPRVLGWALCRKGEVPGPVVYMSRSSIARWAGNDGLDRLTQPQLARAMGRVITHELAHRFLREEGHTSFGVLKAAFDRQALIGFDPRAFRFTAQQVAGLRAAADLRLAARPGSMASTSAK